MRKAILVGVNTGESQEDFLYSMEELENLAEACNITSVATITQNLQRVHQAFYVGKGKLDELKAIVAETEVDLVIFDDELSPSQIRNLEEGLNCEVKDRTMLILDIFAERAKTKESQLQVEVARLKYMMPRLIGSANHLSRQGGGGGTGLKNRGAGETKLELDRRKIEIRIASLSKELEKMVEIRHTQRRLRQKNQLPVVSLVGYTNAGKSTIMNALVERFNKDVDKKVFEKDMLFATLETSVRKIQLETKQELLLTDTVGFINKLPHHLVKAFRSTLEEATEADLLVHVIDYSNPHYENHRKLTNSLLKEIGVQDIPMIYVFNKVDLTSHEYPLVIEDEVYLSAKGSGIDQLLEVIKSHIFHDFVKCELLIPYSKGQIVSYFNNRYPVISMEYEENGTKLVVECSQADADKYNEYITHTF